MLISRRSPRTGTINTMEIPVTELQLQTWQHGARNIQDVMPDLTADQREFLMTGYTPEDWAAIFPPEEDEEEEYHLGLSSDELPVSDVAHTITEFDRYD